tara:strand:+ start:357 stop:848 length:492 start_codon:yes stop_codon:yes gene_type:complete
MSAQFFQSDNKQNNQYLKCADLLVRGNLTVPDGSATFKNLGTTPDGSLTAQGSIFVGAMPTPYVQATSRTTTVTTANEYAFMVNTDTSSIAGHTSVLFRIDNTHVQPNSHIILTAQLPVAGLIYSVAEVTHNYLQVQCSNVTANAITASPRIAIRILDASAPA